MRDTEFCALPSPARGALLVIRSIGARVVEGLSHTGGALAGVEVSPDASHLIEGARNDIAAARITVEACVQLRRAAQEIAA